jgi:superfamily II DNA or RNA helicase
LTFELHDHQTDAIRKLATGKVLVGGVGSGKSITALAYYSKHPSKKIVIITTAKKRNSGEWFADAMKMSLNRDIEVDSWNNISKYDHIENACFIFDEQKLVGNGAWVDSFYKIAKQNDWIVLSATPADVWMDLVPIFIANGFFKNRTEFNKLHVVFDRFAKYPKVDRYLDTWMLEKYRDAIYVEMPYQKKAVREEHIVDVDFNVDEQRKLYMDRWNFYDELPCKDAGEMTRLLRKSANSHPSRYEAVKAICNDNPRVIIFYNHNYELEILRLLHVDLDIAVAEWNGHAHQDIPDTDRWIYLVQYQAGGEGWNCVSTDTMVFYSLPYSYRMFEQAKGRIDRLNTNFEVLHYYIFRSRAIIDTAIWRALQRKKNFQKSAFMKKAWPKEVGKMRRLN